MQLVGSSQYVFIMLSFMALFNNCSSQLRVMNHRLKQARMSRFATTKWALNLVIITLLVLYITCPTTSLLRYRTGRWSRLAVVAPRPDIGYEDNDVTTFADEDPSNGIMKTARTLLQQLHPRRYIPPYTQEGFKGCLDKTNQAKEHCLEKSQSYQTRARRPQRSRCVTFLSMFFDSNCNEEDGPLKMSGNNSTMNSLDEDWRMVSALQNTHVNKPQRRQCPEQLLFWPFFVGCPDMTYVLLPSNITEKAIQKTDRRGIDAPMCNKFSGFFGFFGSWNCNEENAEISPEEPAEAAGNNTDDSSWLSLIKSLEEETYNRRSNIIPRHGECDEHSKNWRKSDCNYVEHSINSHKSNEELSHEFDDGAKNEDPANPSTIFPRTRHCKDSIPHPENQFDCKPLERYLLDRQPRRRNRIRRSDPSPHSRKPGLHPSGCRSGFVQFSDAVHDDQTAQRAHAIPIGLTDLDIYPNIEEEISKPDAAKISAERWWRGPRSMCSPDFIHDLEISTSSTCRRVQPKGLEAPLALGVPNFCDYIRDIGDPLSLVCTRERRTIDLSNGHQDIVVEQSDVPDSNTSPWNAKLCTPEALRYGRGSRRMGHSFGSHAEEDQLTLSELSPRPRKKCRFDTVSKQWVRPPPLLSKREFDVLDGMQIFVIFLPLIIVIIGASIVLAAIYGKRSAIIKRWRKRANLTPASLTQFERRESGSSQSSRSLRESPGGGIAASDGAQDNDTENGDGGDGPDGIQDGWTNWILSRRGNGARLSKPRRFSPSPQTHAPRIPSLTLPKPTFATVRNVSGLPDIDSMAHDSSMGNTKGKGGSRIKWGSTV